MDSYIFTKQEHFLLWKRNAYLLKAQAKARFGLFVKKNFRKPCSKLSNANNLIYLGSGWEWDTYLDTASNKIIKYPSGIFEHLNTPEHVMSVEEKYDLLSSYDSKLVVPTEFVTDADQISLIQKRITPYEQLLVFRDLNQEQRSSLIHILNIMLELMRKHKWMPDLRPKYFITSCYISNITWNTELGRFQLFDFSWPIDLFRIDSNYTQWQIEIFTKRIYKILAKLEK